MKKQGAGLFILLSAVFLLQTPAMAAWSWGKDKTADKSQQSAQEMKPPAAAPAQVGSTLSPAEGKVAYSFADQTQMEAFAKLWQQRQRAVIRLSVLKSYWDEEQTSLEKLNKQFEEEYHLDLKRNYRFDAEHKAIIEVETPPAAAAAAPAGTQQ